MRRAFGGHGEQSKEGSRHPSQGGQGACLASHKRIILAQCGALARGSLHPLAGRPHGLFSCERVASRGAGRPPRARSDAASAKSQPLPLIAGMSWHARGRPTTSLFTRGQSHYGELQVRGVYLHDRGRETFFPSIGAAWARGSGVHGTVQSPLGFPETSLDATAL